MDDDHDDHDDDVYDHNLLGRGSFRDIERLFC